MTVGQVFTKLRSSAVLDSVTSRNYSYNGPGCLWILRQKGIFYVYFNTGSSLTKLSLKMWFQDYFQSKDMILRSWEPLRKKCVRGGGSIHVLYITMIRKTSDACTNSDCQQGCGRTKSHFYNSLDRFITVTYPF